MKLILILGLLLSQQPLISKGSVLQNSTRRILASGSFLHSSVKRTGDIPMPTFSLLSSSIFDDIRKDYQSMEEARQIIRNNHGDEALKKFNEMLSR